MNNWETSFKKRVNYLKMRSIKNDTFNNLARSKGFGIVNNTQPKDKNNSN